MLTLFSWGYEGWGNWTDQLVTAVDAVEASRGWGPPMFVDVRASRSVRAEGFRDKAFERRFGPDRYRWIKGLGNRAIVGLRDEIGLVDPARAADLLDLALDLHGQKRRVLFFCSCVSPTAYCHRGWVARELLELAEKRAHPVTIVEWPGYESDPSSLEAISAKLGSRKSLPLGQVVPDSSSLGRPWFTPVEVGKTWALTGPAQHRAGGWQLPVLGMAPTLREALRMQLNFRRSTTSLPIGWPEPLQVARRRDPVPPETARIDLRAGESLEAAVDRLADGGVLRLEAGRYELHEPLSILQSLRIEGNGIDRTEIVCQSPSFVLSFEGRVDRAMADLTVRHLGSLPANCVLVDEGEVDFMRCRFTGAVFGEGHEDCGSGLSFRGPASGVVRECEMVGNHCGADVCKYASPTLVDSRCSDNAEDGIQVWDASPELEGNVCSRNGRHGIAFLGQTEGVARGNECEGNGGSGIHIEVGSEPSIEPGLKAGR